MTRNKIKKLKEKYNLTQLECDLIRFEGLKLKPYKCTADKWTIGVGRNLEDNPLRLCEVIGLLKCDTKEKKEKFFIGLMKKETAKVNNYMLGYELNETKRHVVFLMVYQMGWSSVNGFIEMFKAIQVKDWERASIEMLDSKWAKQTPNRAKILANRMRTGKIEENGQY